MILKGARLTGDIIPVGDASRFFHPTPALPAPPDDRSEGLRAGLRATGTCNKRDGSQVKIWKTHYTSSLIA
ncbi:MAG: hypothetical protein KME26_13535 [Oscillatoria princeps RMCB-10]|nr:hypothetical protein [Oscillatoria princeps RMCB-10]